MIYAIYEVTNIHTKNNCKKKYIYIYIIKKKYIENVELSEYTIKNKSASWCHWRTFNIWRIVLFHKRLFVAKKVLQIIKRYERDGSLKNFWLNGSWWNQTCFFYGIAVKNLLSTFIFKSVGITKWTT